MNVLLGKSLSLRSYSKVSINHFFISIGILIICTLTMSGANMQLISEHSQQAGLSTHSSINPSLNSKSKISSIVTTDQQYNAEQLNTTDLTFANITLNSNLQLNMKNLVVDSVGNIYIFGYLVNQISHLNTQLFLGKYDPNGNQLWNKTWGTASETGTNIIIDSQGFIYTLEYLTSGIYNPNLQLYMYNTTLLKWNSSGNILWDKIFVSVYPSSTGSCLDKSNNLYLTLPAYPVKTQYGSYSSQNTTVLKLNSTGSILWNKTVNAISISSLTTDLSNSLYLISYSGAFKLNGITGTVVWNNSAIKGQKILVDNVGNIYTFYNANIQKWSSNQTELWILNYYNNSIFTFSDLVLDSLSNIYLTGQNSNEFILAKFDTNGTLLWYSLSDLSINSYGVFFTFINNTIYTLEINISPPSIEYLLTIWNTNGNKLKEIHWNLQPSIIILKSIDDSDGNIYSIGNIAFYTPYNYPYYYVSLSYQILLKYDKTGTLLWSHIWISQVPNFDIYSSYTTSSSGTITTSASDIGIDNAGDVYTLGNDLYNFMLIKWNSDGIPLWNYSFNNFYNSFYISFHTQGKNFQYDNAGNIYILSSWYQSSSSLVPNYSSGIILIKLNPSGYLIWNKTWVLGSAGSSYTPNFLSLLSTSNYNIYIAYGNSLSYGGQTNYYLNLLHIGTNGNINSNKSIAFNSGSNTQFFYSSYGGIVVDNAGSFYIAYYKYSYQNYVGLPNPQPLYRTFFLKYTANGNQVWNKTWDSSPSITIPTSITIDRAGLIYSLVVSAFTTNGTVNTALNVMNTDGNIIWNHSFSNILGANTYVDTSGKILITGISVINYTLSGSAQYNGQIILVSNHSLVDENVSSSGDLITIISNFISDNLISLSVLFLVGAFSGGAGLVYLYKSSLNFPLKNLNPFSKKISDINSSSRLNQQRVSNIFNKKSSLQIEDPGGVNIIEQILIENYQAPDYATALKIQQGGFPDYSTYKQALEKGITSYKDWRKKTS